MKILDFFKKSINYSGVAVTTWAGAVWPDRNYRTFAKESYMMNVIAFRCIDYIAKSMASVEWGVYTTNTEDEREEVKNNPLNEVLRRPNPQMSWNYLQYEVISYLIMSGNAYLYKIGPLTGNNKMPREMWNLRPDRMTIEKDDSGRITEYVYTVDNNVTRFPVDPITGQCDILHLKLFHPLDDYFGMGITEAVAREIDTSNASTAWNKALLDNYARPGMMLIFDKQLTDKQYDRLKKNMYEEREGSENAGKTLILEGGKDAKPYGFSPTEMDWINSNLELSRRICVGYGVAPQLIGIPDTSTYSNYQEARLSFWEETVFFYLSLTKGEYNAWLFLEDDKIFLDYDLSNVPALQSKKDIKWQRAKESDFITINEKREMVGYDPIKGGDVVLVPATMLPLGTEIESDSDIETDANKTIAHLMEHGMSEEEAKEAIGLQ